VAIPDWSTFYPALGESGTISPYTEDGLMAPSDYIAIELRDEITVTLPFRGGAESGAELFRICKIYIYAILILQMAVGW
jgi:hypothetical protein